MKQKFSVLLSVFEKDNNNHLSKCLESIWDKQSIKPNEIIIIKDGILDEYKDNLLTKFQNKAKEKIRVISLEKNLGLGNALNVGLNKCNLTFDFKLRLIIFMKNFSFPKGEIKFILFTKDEMCLAIAPVPPK